MRSRSYEQYCATARALDIVGERWSLLIVRDLLVGARRYTDLLDGLPGLGPNVLSARLKELQAAGVVRRRTLPPPAASTVYELTDVGRRLEPVVDELTRWGLNFLGPRRPGEHFRVAWLLWGMRSSFRPELARGLHETYEFDIDGEVFHVVVDDGTVDLRHGPAGDPTFAVQTDLETFNLVSSAQLDPDDAEAMGRARPRGDREAGRRAIAILGPHLGDADDGGGLAGALHAFFTPAAARGARASVELRIGEHVLHAELGDGDVTVAQGPATHPDVTVICDLTTLLAVGTGSSVVGEALADGRIRLEGDASVLGDVLAAMDAEVTAPAPAGAQPPPASRTA